MAEARASTGRGFSVRRQTGFTTIAVLCFIMLYLPIATLVVYSFNAGVSIAIWEGFSWRWYHRPGPMTKPAMPRRGRWWSPVSRR